MDVLVVEDEAPLRESLVDGLADAFSDLLVEGAGSAEEAESRLAGKSPRLIITDVRLPGKDGAELLLEVRDRLPNTNFIFMSAYPSAEARGRARDHDIHFLRKPFEFGDLLDIAESLLERKDFSGELGGISLVDLLQVLNLGRRTAAVSLKHRDELGKIFLSEGEVVHAVVGDLAGRDAFDRLMSWKGGSFGSEPGCEPPVRTISESFNALLLDCFREQDEQGEEITDASFDDFDANFLAADSPEDELHESAGGSLDERLESALRTIPGCVASGCVDLGDGALLGLLPGDAIAEPIREAIPKAVEALFSSAPLRELDSALSAGGEKGRPGGSTIAEIIVISSEFVHHFQAAGTDPESVLVAVSKTARSLGIAVAKARDWKKSFEKSDGNA